MEEAALAFLIQWSAPLLRGCTGVVFVWFGALKLVPGLSPAETLVVRTTEVLTFGLLSGAAAHISVGAFEVALGICLMTWQFPRLTTLAFLGHMAGTVSPLALFPELTWKAPLTGTMEGQYILKNLVLIAAVLVASALSHDPHGSGRPPPDRS
ncbi:DoxX family protein [Streptomyces sp. NPDC002537]